MVETFDVSITPYGLTRRTFVYLPDDWQTSGKKYPVLYMFDGHNLFFDSTATYGTCWGLKDYLDAHPNAIVHRSATTRATSGWKNTVPTGRTGSAALRAPGMNTWSG